LDISSLEHGAVRSPIDSPNLNQGAYGKMENELADWIDHGMEVRLDIELLDYVDGRPSTYGINYQVFDPNTGKLVHFASPTFENGPGQSFNRFRKADMQEQIAKVNGAI